MERDLVVVIESATVCRDYRRAVSDDGRSIQLLHDGYTSVNYVVEVDRNRLHAMAQRAYKNKNGQAVAGPVRVRIVKRQKMEAKQHGS